jgi:hypothetical protein
MDRIALFYRAKQRNIEFLDLAADMLDTPRPGRQEED